MNVIGIDFGTTNSVVSIWRDNKPEIFESQTSAVAFTETEEILVGKAAVNLIGEVPNIIFDGMKMLGKIYTMMEQNQYYTVTEDEKKRAVVAVQYPGKKVKYYTAEDVATILRKSIRDRAQAHLGDAIKYAVIAVPATMDTNERESLLKVAKVAGFENIQLINNTTAAATTYRLAVNLEIEDLDDRSRFVDTTGVTTKKTVLVCDVGSGMLTVSIVALCGGESNVLASCEEVSAGGENWLKRLVEHFTDALVKKGYAIKGNKSAMMNLRNECEKAMIRMDHMPSATIQIKLPNHPLFDVEVTRVEFEMLNKTGLQKVMITVDECLQEAPMNASGIDEYLLIGRASNTSCIRSELESVFKKKSCKGIQISSTVSLGACIQAANFAAATSDEKTRSLSVWEGGMFREVTTLSVFVVDDKGNNKDVVIPKLKKIPCRVVHNLAYAGRWIVYQGDVFVREIEGTEENGTMSMLFVID